MKSSIMIKILFTTLILVISNFTICQVPISKELQSDFDVMADCQDLESENSIIIPENLITAFRNLDLDSISKFVFNDDILRRGFQKKDLKKFKKELMKTKSINHFAKKKSNISYLGEFGYNKFYYGKKNENSLCFRYFFHPNSKEPKIIHIQIHRNNDLILSEPYEFDYYHIFKNQGIFSSNQNGRLTYQEAIKIQNEWIYTLQYLNKNKYSFTNSTNRDIAMEYGKLAQVYITMNKATEAYENSKAGLELDPSIKKLNIILIYSCLLENKINEAFEILESNKTETIDGDSFNQVLYEDIESIKHLIPDETYYDFVKHIEY